MTPRDLTPGSFPEEKGSKISFSDMEDISWELASARDSPISSAGSPADAPGPWYAHAAGSASAARPRKLGLRSTPPSVHSVNRTSHTNSGAQKCAPAGIAGSPRDGAEMALHRSRARAA